jgi:hypothetical protein
MLIIDILASKSSHSDKEWLTNIMDMVDSCIRPQPETVDDWLWLRDATREGRVWFVVPEVGMTEAPPTSGMEVISGPEAVQYAQEALRRLGFEKEARRLERAYQQVLRGRRGRIAHAVAVLEAALRGGYDLPSQAEIVWAWADLILLVEGKDALYRQYEIIKRGARQLRDQAARAIRGLRTSRAAAQVRRLIARAKRELRRSVKKPALVLEPGQALNITRSAPKAPPPKALVQEASGAGETTAPGSNKLHRRGEKAAVVKAAADKAAAEKAAAKRRAAEKKAAALRRAAKRGVVEALRRRKAATLRAKRAAEHLPAVAAAVMQLVRQGVVSVEREQALALAAELRAGVKPARLSELVSQFELGPAVAHLMTAWDGVPEEDAFKLAVSAVAGGREYEQRLIEALRQLGAEVRTDQSADRRAGVDMLVLVDGKSFAVQLSIMPWLAATAPSREYASKRLENGAVRYGAAVSKVQKDLEKFERRYAKDVPFVYIGVNAVAPFTPEQYAAAVLRLLEGQGRWLTGAAAFFFWAPDKPAVAVQMDSNTKEEVQR